LRTAATTDRRFSVAGEAGQPHSGLIPDDLGQELEALRLAHLISGAEIGDVPGG
jgi:hypothetical protein